MKERTHEIFCLFKMVPVYKIFGGTIEKDYSFSDSQRLTKAKNH